VDFLDAIAVLNVIAWLCYEVEPEFCLERSMAKKNEIGVVLLTAGVFFCIMCMGVFFCIMCMLRLGACVTYGEWPLKRSQQGRRGGEKLHVKPLRLPFSLHARVDSPGALCHVEPENAQFC
jgi:hypothetical protein